jgi:hypothetical protein
MNEIFKLDMVQAMKLLGMCYQQHCDVNENENENDICLLLIVDRDSIHHKIGPTCT